MQEQIAKSILITSLVSFIGSMLVTIILKEFFPGMSLFAVSGGLFVLIFILQFIVFFFINERREVYQNQIEKIALEYANSYNELLEKQSTPILLTCAYCQNQQYAPISLLSENNYICNTCNQNNKVYINMQTVRVTLPMEKTTPIAEIKMDDE